MTVSGYPPYLVDAVAATIAEQHGRRVFDRPDRYPNNLLRQVYRDNARQLLDLLDREGALRLPQPQ